MATRPTDLKFASDPAVAAWRKTRTTPGRSAAPPFRAEHVGALSPPLKLLSSRRLFERRVITAEALLHFEDAAIRQAAKYQESLGLRGITDGGFRHGQLHSALPGQLGSMRASAEASATRRNFSFLKSVTCYTAKVAIPAPTMMHYGGGRVDTLADAYPDSERLDADLASAYARELELLASAGCTYVQLDDGHLADLCDGKEREAVRQRGGDPDRLLRRYVRLVNAAIASRPASMTACVYLCRGRSGRSWVGEAVHEPAVELLFNELQVEGYFLRYDEAGARELALLRHVPRAKRVVLGLVSLNASHMQRKHDLKRSIDGAARYARLEDLCLSPQSGFLASDRNGGVSTEVQSAKLRLVVETAREVWGE